MDGRVGVYPEIEIHDKALRAPHRQWWLAEVARGIQLLRQRSSLADPSDELVLIKLPVARSRLQTFSGDVMEVLATIASS